MVGNRGGDGVSMGSAMGGDDTVGGGREDSMTGDGGDGWDTGDTG